MSSLSISSYGNLGTAGFSSPMFQYSAGGKAVCVSGIAKIPVTATASTITYQGPKNNYELTELLTDLFRLESDAFVRYISGQTIVSDTFSIYSKLCVPKDGKNKDFSTVQFLTHGGTVDSSYWDFASGYSYVDAAAQEGYATFSYDRLGTGKSQRPDPKQVVQAPLQVDLAHAIIQKLKAGEVGSIRFKKVVGIGHSLGSAVTQSVSSRFPDDFDAIVLTGHSAYQGGAGIGFASAAQQIANTLLDRTEFKDLPNGYFTLGPAPQTLQFAFFYYPKFDPEIFLKEFRTRQTNALGETFTLGGLYQPVLTFTKPLLVVNGKQDYFYCRGNCEANGDITAQALKIFYPNAAKSSQAITLPDTGHNINLHLNRRTAFTEILKFIEGLGIQP